MRDQIVLRPQQRTLAFVRQELWPRLPDPDRRRCCELCGQLLRAVLQAEASTRSEDARETPDRPS